MTSINNFNKIKLALFTGVGIFCLVIIIFFIGRKQQLFNSTFLIKGVFKDISGLQVGNNVRFSGINVGIIDGIQQLTDSTVQVDMLIDEQSRPFIKQSAKALIGTDGLMGNKLILIAPGTGSQKVITDGSTIETVQPITMDEILQNLKRTTDHSASITGDLSAIIGNIRQGNGTIGKLLMDTTMANNVGTAMVNIKQGAGGFKKNMDAASHNVLLRGFIKKKKKEKEKEPDKK